MHRSESPAQALARSLSTLGSAKAMEELTRIVDALSPAQATALRFAWTDFWARPGQCVPDGVWRTWGGITGKGWGKTRAMAEAVNHLVEHRGKRRIGLIAQREESVWKTMIHGESGIIATAPPWSKPFVYREQVVWPCGAIAQVLSANSPNQIPGPQFDLGWASELQEWPPTTREQAWFLFSAQCRAPGAQLIWDANPAKDHPVLEQLIDMSDKDPSTHRIVRSSVMDNLCNLDADYLKSLETYRGTQAWDMLVEGIVPFGEEGALVQKEWISKHRVVSPPSKVVRCVVAMDPAISTHEKSDATGIVVAALADDGCVYALADMSGKHDYDKRCKIVLEAYRQHRCDCLIVEENRGGDWIKMGLQSECKELGLAMADGNIESKPPPHTPRAVFVKWYRALASKGERLAPVAPHYQSGRVVHVGNFHFLEKQLTNYVPGQTRDSPNSVDALVYCVNELLGMWPGGKKHDNKKTMQGLNQVNAQSGRQAGRRQLLNNEHLHPVPGKWRI